MLLSMEVCCGPENAPAQTPPSTMGPFRKLALLEEPRVKMVPVVRPTAPGLPGAAVAAPLIKPALEAPLNKSCRAYHVPSTMRGVAGNTSLPAKKKNPAGTL